jgi:hypothetical protein
MMASGDAELRTILAMGEIAARQQEAMHVAARSSPPRSRRSAVAGRAAGPADPGPTGAALPAHGHAGAAR